MRDAGIAGEIHSAEIETAKYWQYINIKELCELLIQRARRKALLTKHTNLGLVWKFSIGSDKAGGVHYTHLSLDNTLKPASSKTSHTIQGIYDPEENFKRRTLISKKINDQLSKLHMKCKINHQLQLS